MQKRQLKIIGLGVQVKTYKEGRAKAYFDSSKHSLKLSNQMSSQITNNNYATAPTSLNPYVSRKLNNMKEAQAMKKE